MTEPYDYTDDRNSAEALDEDRLAVDPLELGIEPTERRAEADRTGLTPREQAEGSSLDERLSEEEREVPIDDGFDERREDDPVEEPPPPRTASERLSEAERRGQAADVAGGSVADALRGERSDGR